MKCANKYNENVQTNRYLVYSVQCTYHVIQDLFSCCFYFQAEIKMKNLKKLMRYIPSFVAFAGLKLHYPYEVQWEKRITILHTKDGYLHLSFHHYDVVFFFHSLHFFCSVFFSLSRSRFIASILFNKEIFLKQNGKNITTMTPTSSTNHQALTFI